MDFNGPDAMRRAGFPHCNGWRSMLADKRVEAIVREELNRRGLRSRIDPDEVIRELESMAFGSIADLVDLIPDPNDPTRQIPVIKPMDQLSTSARGSIKEIEIMPSGGIKIKMHDKKAALELIGKHLGLFNADQSGNRDVVVTVRQFVEGDDDATET